MLRAGQEGKADRIAELEAHGFPGYTTAPGWLGYSDEKMQHLAREAVAEGFTLIKMKVAGNVEDDKRRMRLVREAVGPDIRIAVDANQRWEVDEAGPWINQLQEFNLWWVEEPTSPDDILGHARIREEIAPIRVATGEAVQNRIVFKQLLQAGAIDVMQIDSTPRRRSWREHRQPAPGGQVRRSGVPARGRSRACANSCSTTRSSITRSSRAPNRTASSSTSTTCTSTSCSPVKLTAGHYEAPTAPGIGAEMLPESVAKWTYPDGAGWAALRRRVRSGSRSAPVCSASFSAGFRNPGVPLLRINQ